MGEHHHSTSDRPCLSSLALNSLPVTVQVIVGIQAGSLTRPEIPHDEDHPA